MEEVSKTAQTYVGNVCIHKEVDLRLYALKEITGSLALRGILVPHLKLRVDMLNLLQLHSKQVGNLKGITANSVIMYSVSAPKLEFEMAPNEIIIHNSDIASITGLSGDSLKRLDLYNFTFDTFAIKGGSSIETMRLGSINSHSKTLPFGLVQSQHPQIARTAK
ncbi:hypothetical protein DSO57_1026743 [Entomophthora muscae]|uniref:Uncharacterized protein n=1 Tax=Entomophthora muscae TaxID=34485 RepID=A0ACC2RGQ8_9FUNG|nr:hypothetical protein DSO57_1026743 [Entomophthora muscae]